MHHEIASNGVQTKDLTEYQVEGVVVLYRLLQEYSPTVVVSVEFLIVWPEVFGKPL